MISNFQHFYYNNKIYFGKSIFLCYYLTMKTTFICASYNYEKYITEAIESVIAQDYSDWELIVFDDGSKDNSISVISEYCKKDSRIKLLTHPNNENRGLIATLKAASEAASGDWLAFIESDDKLKPNYLRKKLEALRAYPEAKLIFSGVEILGNKDIQDNYIQIFKKRNEFIKNDFNIAVLIRENIIPTFSCVMIEKNLFKTLDFNSPIGQNIDWWLWAQVLSKNKVMYVDENLSIWRRHENSYITSIDTKKMNNFLKSIFNFIFKSDKTLAPYLLFRLHLFFDSRTIRKLFGTPARKICAFALKNLYKMNNIKANLCYYSN